MYTQVLIYHFHDCRLNSDRVLLERQENQQKIEPQVFDVLLYLVQHHGRVVTREELLDRVWGHEHVSESTLSSCIKLARKAVGDDGRRQAVIRTVHGRGYEFVAALEKVTDPDNADPDSADSRSTTRALTRIPAALQALIGRETVVRQIRVDLHTSRLITLVGPGGVGKTSLAYELARSVEGLYPDGVAAVELVSAGDPESTVESIAAALRVHTPQDSTLEDAVLDLLRTREMLLLLDNCEHLVDAVSGIAGRIMRTAPGVTVLATSREPLAVSGEKIWPIEPLAFLSDEIERGPMPDLPALAALPAVELFIERAKAADPHFVLDQATAPAVIEICRRLDGMPLAIELAASRARSIGVDQIARRLDQRFRLLKRTRRGPDPRHQTLRDTVLWSFELLEPDDQRFFSELSVFSGQFDLDALEAICGTDSESDVFDLITRLVERSMVTIRRPGQSGVRYELLDTLRTFGREQLDPDSRAGLFDRHASFHVALSRSVEAGLQTASEPRFLRDADASFPDLRAAFRHLTGSSDVGGAMEMVCALREYAMRTMRYEALTWAGSAVALDGAEAHPLHATAKAIQAYAAWVRGEFESSQRLARRASEEERERSLVPCGLVERVLANVLYVKGDTQGGLEATTRQLELAEDSGNHSRQAHACYMHSIALSSLGELEHAEVLARRAAEHAHRSSSPTDIASALTADGFTLCDDPDAALETFTRAGDIASQGGNRWLSTFARTEVCRLRLELGDLEHARKNLADVVDIWFRAGEWAQQWLTLTGCVVANFALGKHDLAARTIGAIEKRAMLGALPVTASLREQAFGVVDDLTRRLGGERYAELVGQGAAMPVTEVVQQNRTALLE